MLTERVSTATRDLWRSVTACARNVLTLRARYRAMMDAREARGISDIFGNVVCPMLQSIECYDANRIIELSSYKIVDDGFEISSLDLGLSVCPGRS